MGLILSQKGSAPGQDGIPYEVLGQGTYLITEILLQAFHVASTSLQALRTALGAALDLLAWIPKVEGGPSVLAQRPLPASHVPQATLWSGTGRGNRTGSGAPALPATGGEEGRQLRTKHSGPIRPPRAGAGTG